MAEPEPLHTLLAHTAEAVLQAQRRLDEATSGMHSVPCVDASFEFGLLTRTEKKFFFIPRGQSRDLLRHRLSFTLIATPQPPPALQQPIPEDHEPLPLLLLEPPFLVSDEDANEILDRLQAALEAGRWRAVMSKPEKLTQKKASKARETIQASRESPDESRPHLGPVVFSVGKEAPAWLVVHVTKRSANDGIFLVPEGDSPVVDIFTLAGDANEKLAFLPLDLLVGAVRRWLSGAAPRRTLTRAGLPRRWGIASLEFFARRLLEGYITCCGLLAAQDESGALPVCYELLDVKAELSFSISYAAEDTRFSIVQKPADSGELIDGRILLKVERGENSARLSLTLQAPGYILSSDRRDAFMARVRDAGNEIADAFTLDPLKRAEYIQQLQKPARPKEVVVFVSAEEADEALEFLAVWPAGDRDFAFSCRQGRRRLEDFQAVLGLDDDAARASIDTPESEAGLSESQYEHFSRFFRATRLWTAGFRT